MLAAAVAMLATFPNLALTWDDLAWLRDGRSCRSSSRACSAEDAQRAHECGVDGIVVSNHGGRVDGAVAPSMRSWRSVMRSGRPVVLMDSGIRRGSDV